MYEVLQLVGDKDHGPFVILQKLEDSFLHQVIAQVDVQRGERIVLLAANRRKGVKCCH